MSIFIASSILLVIGSAYAILLKRKLTETIFLAVATVVGVLYCFGLINIGGCLLFGIYCLVLLSLFCVIYFIYSFTKNRKILFKIEFIQGCILFICILGLSFLINYKRMFNIWDEYAIWGANVKYFYFVDAFGTFDNQKLRLIRPFYPPGTSLFQYFFMRFSGQFTEYYTYIAQNILYCSLFLPFICNIFNKGKRIKSLLLFVMFLLLPLIFRFQAWLYDSIYVDAILGAFFGFAVLYYFVYKYEESLYGILMVSSTVFLMVLAKDNGLPFSLGIIGIIAADILFYKRSEIKNFISLKPGVFNKLKHITLIILPFISILFVKITWSNLTKHINASLYNVHTRLIFSISFNDIILFITNKITPYQKEVVKAFLSVIKSKPVLRPYITLPYFCIIFIVLLYIFPKFIKNKLYSVRIMIAGVLFALGAFIYQFVLLLFYIFVHFRQIKALQAAGYERYTSSYLLGMSFFFMIFFILDQTEFKEIKIKKINIPFNKYSLIGIVFLLLIFSRQELNILLKRRQINPQFLKRRQEIILAANEWRSWFDVSNPYIITQGINGSLCFLMNLELCPNSSFANAADRDFNISTKPVNDFTFVVSPEEWEKYIISNEYKLLYVFRSNHELETTYGHFFPNGVRSNMVYHVENNDGHILLIPVK